LLRAQEHYFGLRRLTRHKQRRFGCRHPERRGICNQNVRLKLINFAQTLRCVAGFAHHVNVRLVCQQPPQTLP
jgi:hypothetical protein